jgi:hypothetical protein
LHVFFWHPVDPSSSISARFKYSRVH